MEVKMKMASVFRTRAIICFLTLGFITSFRGITNVLMAYILQSYSGYAPELVQNIQTLPGLIALPVTLLIGPLALKFNKKYLTFISTAAMGLYFVIFAVVGAKGLIWLLVASGLLGITEGSLQNLCIAFLSDFIEPEKKATYVALSSGLQNAGAILNNSLGGALAAGNNGANWFRGYYPGLIIIPIAILFLILMPDVKKINASGEPAAAAAHSGGGKTEGGLWTGLRKMPKLVWLICLTNIFVVYAMCAYRYNFSVYVITEYNLGTSVQTGIASSVYSVLGMLAGFTFAFWQKMLKKWLVPFGFVCMAASLGLHVLIHTSLPVVYIAAGLFGFGFSISTPRIMALLSNIAGGLGPVAISLYCCAGSLATYTALYVNNFFAGMLGGSTSDKMMVGLIWAAGITVVSLFLYPFNKKAPKEM